MSYGFWAFGWSLECYSKQLFLYKRVPNFRSTLHAPGGVLGAIRTPLHAVLGILRPEAGGGNPAASLTSRPKLCEAAYRLLYVLAANPQTSEPTLRYLRCVSDNWVNGNEIPVITY